MEFRSTFHGDMSFGNERRFIIRHINMQNILFSQHLTFVRWTPSWKSSSYLFCSKTAYSKALEGNNWFGRSIFVLYSGLAFPEGSSSNRVSILYLLLRRKGTGNNGCPICVKSHKHLITGLEVFRDLLFDPWRHWEVFASSKASLVEAGALLEPWKQHM